MVKLATVNHFRIIPPLALGVLLAGLCPPTARAQPAPAANAGPIQTQSWKELTAVAGDRDWRAHICALATPAILPSCDPKQIHVFQPVSQAAPAAAKPAAESEFYAILPGPALAHLAHAGHGSWRLIRGWNFSDYRLLATRAPQQPVQDTIAGGNAMQNNGIGPVSAHIDLFPALFPLGPDRWGIAAIGTRLQTYAGGSGAWQTADILPLDQDGPHPATRTPAYASLPFACHKDIRACFSEQDSKTNPHCRDEFTGNLQFQYQASADPQHYDWTANWAESHWPGGVPQTQAIPRDVSRPLTQPDSGLQLRHAIPFCEPPDAE